jgi:lipoprotein signal peptidase
MTTFSLHEQQDIIPGFFNLVYVTNTGAAFGFLAGSKTMLRQEIMTRLNDLLKKEMVNNIYFTEFVIQ